MSVPSRKRSGTRVLAGGLLGALLACAAPLCGAMPARADAAHLADASADKVEASVAVPEPSRKVGEVRLVTRGSATVVQTLLSTKLLSRVINEIGAKEARNWSQSGDDAKTSRDYMAALGDARQTLEKRDPAAHEAVISPKRRLLIEFAADQGDATVLVGTFTSAADTDLTPQSREIFTTLTPPRKYVLRNMRLILADSFKVPESEVDRLGPLGPAAAEKSATSPPGAGAPPAPAAAASAPGKDGAATDGAKVGVPVER